MWVQDWGLGQRARAKLGSVAGVYRPHLLRHLVQQLPQLLRLEHLEQTALGEGVEGHLLEAAGLEAHDERAVFLLFA
jgi:hypothetical protein